MVSSDAKEKEGVTNQIAAAAKIARKPISHGNNADILCWFLTAGRWLTALTSVLADRVEIVSDRYRWIAQCIPLRACWLLGLIFNACFRYSRLARGVARDAIINQGSS